MASTHPLAPEFALLVPLSATAVATTSVRRNLPYIGWHKSINATSSIKRRVVRLTFETIAGRRSFTFGASRASDYQLPNSNGIAMHHFIMFFDPLDRALYISNTSPELMHITSAISGNIVLTTSNSPLRIASSSTTITIGHKLCRFELVLPTFNYAFEDAVTAYLLSISSPISPDFIKHHASKKRKGSAAITNAYAPKRLCGRSALEVSNSSDKNTAIPVYGWFGRAIRTFSTLLGC